jgi:hypothetical protein
LVLLPLLLLLVLLLTAVTATTMVVTAMVTMKSVGVTAGDASIKPGQGQEFQSKHRF